MLHLARHLALGAVALALTGSVAHANKKAAKKPAPAPVVVEDDGEDEADAAPKKTTKKTGRVAFAEIEDAVADDSTAEDDDDFELEPVVVKKPAATAAAKAQDWHLTIGTDLWLASVDANVSVGGSNVASGINFASLSKHAKFGVPVVAEARYGRFAVTGDLLYGAIGLAGATSVGPVMAKLDGDASSLQLDTFGGYMVTGGDDALLSIEARGGMRYQRTAVSASVDVGMGGVVAPPQIVMGGKDALLGARVFVRPFHRLWMTGAADVGVFGSSSSTWSASVDANLRVAKHLMVTAGWRTLTADGGAIGTVMHGPRFAIQLMF